MTFAAGDQLGPYKILSALGRGGMGEVYLARDTRLNRDVALKALPSRAASDPQALRRMEQEARAVAALNHPNLLSVHDIGHTADGLPYVVFELLEGETLRERLRLGALDMRKAVDYATQIARGLAAAHDQGIVHRDLKPENIFVTSDGRVKILDFGLAKRNPAAAGDDVTLAGPEMATSPGIVLGTVGYMSPEQVRAQPADARSDIFSFGAVFYEMVSGKRAFPGNSAADVMSAVLNREPEPLTRSSGGDGQAALSPALERTIRHCLEKSARERFQSANDIAFQLSDPTQVLSVQNESADSGGRGRRRWAMPLALAALAAIIAWLVLRPSPAASPPTLVRLTYHSGKIASARFLSGDQNFLVSAEWNGGPLLLYQGQTPSGGELAPLPQPVAGAANVTVASVAPNGAIALLTGDPDQSRFDNSPGQLSVIPAGGGAPHPLLDHIWSAAWARDGATLAIARFDPESRTTTVEYPPGHVLYRTSGWCTDLSIAHDGQRIAFLDHPQLGDTRGRAAFVTLDGQERVLTPMFEDTRGLAWAPDGREIWFTAGQENDQRAIYSADFRGRVRRLWQTPGDLTMEDVLPDGRVLLATDDKRNSARLLSTSFPNGTDITIRQYSGLVALSGDGGTVLLDDGTGGATPNYSTYLLHPGIAPAERLGDGVPLALSPNGQWALSWQPDAPLLLLPTGAGQSRRLAPEFRFSYAGAAFLPDGSGVLAVAQQRTYRVGLNGSAKPVTPVGVTGWLPTPDGKFVLAADAAKRWALYPLAGGLPVPQSKISAADLPLRFASGDDVLFVLRRDGLARGDIYRLNLTTGQRALLHQITVPDVSGSSLSPAVSISADGATVAFCYSTVHSTLYILSGLP